MACRTLEEIASICAQLRQLAQGSEDDKLVKYDAFLLDGSLDTLQDRHGDDILQDGHGKYLKETVVRRQIANNNEAWAHVIRSKRLDSKGNPQDCWTCHYCSEVKTGNVGRVEAHLGDVPGLGITGCTGNVPVNVRTRMALAANQKKENKKRKCITASDNPANYALGFGNSDLDDDLFQFDNLVSAFEQGSNGEVESNSSGNSTCQLPPPNTVSKAMLIRGMPSQRSNLHGIWGSGMVGPVDAVAGSSNPISSFGKIAWDDLEELLKESYALKERELAIKRQQEHLEWIRNNVTTGEMKINQWFKRLGQVREQYHCLVKVLVEAVSAGSTMQLREMIEGLRKEVIGLMEQSREFDILAAKTMLEFMNCRLENPFKHHLKETLPLPLA